MADNTAGLSVVLDTDRAIENAKKLEDALIAIEDVVKKVNATDLSTLKDIDFGKMMKGSLAEAESSLKEINKGLKNGIISATAYDEIIAQWRDKYKEVLKLNDSLNAKVIKTPSLPKGEINKIKGGAKLTDLNIPQTEQAIKVIDNQIAMMGDKINKSYQQRLVNSKTYYAEELKVMRTSTSEKERLLAREVDAQRKAEEKKARQQEKITQQAAAQAELAEKQAYQQRTSTVFGAMNLPNRSIDERMEKMRALQAVQRSLKKDDNDYAVNLRKVNNEIRNLDKANKQATTSGIKLDNAKRRLINTADQLTRRFALIFSVSQITGYVRKLVDVRGEFELQSKSLAAIIQNKNEADKLFGQITELAVKSPFQLKELITYTKQLSAYRIETGRLFDTTKMLADVSAGLGVDMNRLTLAYGQVKAANYLRGQELRQFSEAGINILGELATKLSKVSGRIVSIGEVSGMVSKKMISFKDVDEVFQSMTKSGGIFYNMQELQAETLKGKVSNLTDAIDIMLNKIGTEQESTLKGAVDAVRYLIENYDIFINIILRLIAAFGLYRASQMLYNKTLGTGTGILDSRILAEKRYGIEILRRRGVIQSLTIAEKKRLIELQRTSNVVTAADYKNVLSTQSLTSSQAKLLVMIKSRNTEFLKAVIQTGLLTKAEVKAYTTGNILNKSLEIACLKLKTVGIAMKSLMVSMLPLFALSSVIESVMAITSAYNHQSEESKKLAEKQNELTVELVKIRNGFDEAFSKAKKYNEEIKKSKAPNLDLKTNFNKSFGESLVKLKEYADKAQELGVGYTIDFGTINIDNIEQAKKAYDELIVRSNDYQIILTNQMTKMETWWGGDGEFFGNTMEKDLKQLNSSYDELFRGDLNKRLTDIGILMQENTKYLSDYQKGLISQFNIAKKDNESELDFNERRLKLLKSIQDIVVRDAPAYSGNKERKFWLENQELAEDYYDRYAEFNSDRIEAEKEIKESIENSVKALNIDVNKLTPEDKRALKIGIDTAIANKGLQGFAKDLAQKTFYAKFGLQTFNFAQITQTVADTWKESLKKVENISSLFEKDQIDGLKDIIELTGIVQNKYAEITKSIKDLKKQKGTDPAIQEQQRQELANYDNILKVLNAISLLTGIKLNKDAGGNGKDPKLERIQKQIKAIEDAKKAYDDYEKKVGSSKAREYINKEFSDIFSGLGLSIDMDFDEAGIVGEFTKIMKKASGAGKKELKNKIGKIEIEAEVNVITQGQQDIRSELDKAFANYELTMELESTGVPLDWIKELFGAEAIDDKALSNKITEMMNGVKDVNGISLYDVLFQKDGEGKQKEISELTITEFIALQDRLLSLKKNYAEFDFDTAKEGLNKIMSLRVGSEKKTVQELLSLREKLATNSQKLVKETGKLTGYENELSKFKSIKDKELTIEQKLQKELLELQIANSELVIAELENEAFKSTDIYKRLYEDITLLSIQKLKKLIEDYRDTFDKSTDVEKGGVTHKGITFTDESGNIKTNTITVAEYTSALNKFTDAEKRLRDLNPFEKMKESFKKGGNFAAGIEAIGVELGKVGGIAKSIGNIAELFGADEKTLDIINGVSQSLGGLATMSGGIAKAMSGDIIGGLFDYITGLTEYISGIFNTAQAKNKAIVRDSKKEIESLSKAYDKLEKARNAATNYQDEQTNYETQKKNLEDQEAAIRRAQEANSKLKGKNKEDNQVYLDQLYENEQKRKELEDSRNSSYGVIEFKDAVMELADAWLEARNAGGDTLDALNKKVKEFVANFIKQQMIMAGLDEIMKPFIEKMKNAINPNGPGASKVTKEELDELLEEGKKLGPSIGDFFDNVYGPLYDAIDDSMPDLDSGNDLSGLQKGIEGVTEETAGALESLINTIVYEMFRNSAVVEERLLYICDTLTMINSIANRSLAELSGIHTVVKEMRAWQKGITKAGHPSGGGDGIRVWIS